MPQLSLTTEFSVSYLQLNLVSLTRIDNVELILDLSKLHAVPCKLTVIQINLPLDWHHRNGNAEVIPMKKMLKHKADKLKVLIKVIEGYTLHDIVMAVEDGNDNVEIFDLDEDSDEGL